MDTSVIIKFEIALSQFDLDENTFNSCMKTFIRYLLGLSKYKEALNSLPLKCAKKVFKETLLSLTVSEVHYCRTLLRRAARKERIKLSTLADKYYLKQYVLDQDDIAAIKIFRYPKLLKVFKDMRPSMMHNMNKLYMSSSKSFKSMYTKKCLYSIMNIKILELYKLYIHPVKTNLDLLAFYKILHNSINGLKIDLIRKSNAIKRFSNKSNLDVYEMHLPTVTMLDKTQWAPSPENTLIFKQKILNSNLCKLDKLTLLKETINQEDITWI